MRFSEISELMQGMIEREYVMELIIANAWGLTFTVQDLLLWDRKAMLDTGRARRHLTGLTLRGMLDMLEEGCWIIPPGRGVLDGGA